MEPWQSWTIIGVLGAGGYWYYTHSQKRRRGRAQKPAPVNQPQRHSSNALDDSKGANKKGKGKATEGGGRKSIEVTDMSSASATTSGSEKITKRKKVKKSPSKLGQSSSVNVEPIEAANAASNEPEQAIDNAEFAKQMAGLKSGMSLEKPDTIGETKKTRRQGKQNESRQVPANGKAVELSGGAGSHEISTTSSTTGADADDDLSPVASPDLGDSHMTSGAGGVADMLEAPAKGPSILRLTSPTQLKPERQPKLKKAAPEPETKKQRQNRQKNEEKKAAREEAERERHVLLEKQRRTAREAEGRLARNGSGSVPPTTNAWLAPKETAKPNGSSTVVSSNVYGSLLDTFEESSKSAKTSGASDINGSYADQKAWEKDVPSEEEQMRMLSEMDDDGWNTVAKGGKAKKKKATYATDDENKSSISDDHTNSGERVDGNELSERKRPSAINTSNGKSKGPPSPMFGLVPPKFKTTKDQVDPKVWNRSNIHNHPEYDPEYPYALTGHPEDSDWAVV